MILLIILYAIIALTFVFAKDAVLSASPLCFVSIRMLCAGCLLYGLQMVREKRIYLPKKNDLVLFFIIALLHIYIPFAGEFWALTKMDALKVNFLYSLTPFFALTLQALIDAQFPRLRVFAGIMIGFCALTALLIMNDQPSHLLLQDNLFALSLPEIVLLVSIVSATAAWFLIAHMMKKRYSIDTINAWSMLVGGFFILCTAWTIEDIAVMSTYGFFKNLIMLIILSNIIFYNLYGILLHRYSVTTITTAGFLSPLFGMLLQSISQQQIPDPLYLVSLLFVLIGLFLMKEKQ
jgi:drug/metabolite transporter (DMT)-like permease